MACYAPDGSDINTLWKVADGDLYAPCNVSAPVSMCCAIGPNRTNPDVCVDNGFCHNAYFGDKDQIWRESCTDPTWKDPACIKLFVNGTGINATMGVSLDDNGNKINDVLITECDDGSHCYGDNNRECCRQGQGVFILNGEQVTFNPTAASSTSISSTTTSTSRASSTTSATQSQGTSIPSPPATSSESHSSGLSTGAEAGIGVGVAAGVIVTFGFCFWLFRRRRSNNTPELETKDHPVYQSQPDPLSMGKDPTTSGTPHADMSELHADSRVESYRDSERYELGDR